MSRPLRDSLSDASTIHSLKSDDGINELNAGDISLPASAAAFTTVDTIEQWLERMQAQINALAGITAVLTVPQLAGVWQEQPQLRTDPRWFQPDTEAFVKI